MLNIKVISHSINHHFIKWAPQLILVKWNPKSNLHKCDFSVWISFMSDQHQIWKAAASFFAKRIALLILATVYKIECMWQSKYQIRILYYSSNTPTAKSRRRRRRRNRSRPRDNIAKWAIIKQLHYFIIHNKPVFFTSHRDQKDTHYRLVSNCILHLSPQQSSIQTS